jgi:hypothetical protein
MLLTKAVALVIEDPGPGVIRLKRGETANVVPGELPGQRRVAVHDREGREITMVRFASQPVKADEYPASIPFLGDVPVWVGASSVGQAAVWCHVKDTAEFAATVVTSSVTAGWELESAAHIRFPTVKAVYLIKGQTRRIVAVMFGSVTLTEAHVS